MGRVIGATGLSSDWRKIIFDQGDHRFRIDPQVGLPDGGRLLVPDFKLLDLHNAQGRFMTADHCHVGQRPPQASHDQTGSYWDISPFCEGMNAFVYRAIPSAPNPWSLGNDFCVGMCWPRLSRRLPHGQPGLDQLHWRAARGAGMPNPGVRSHDTLTLHWSRTWGPGAAFEGNTLRETMYLLVGTYDQVINNVAFLRNTLEP